VERKPDLYIGKQPWYINFIGVDKTTGEETEISDKGTFVAERWDGFAKTFGYVRVGVAESS